MKIGIYGQFYHENAGTYINQLLELLQEEKVEVIIERNFLDLINKNKSVTGEYSDYKTFDILDASCDLAIRISDPPGDKSTIWRRICHVPRQVVAAPALFDRIARPAHPGDLPPDQCLSYGHKGSAEIWTFTRGGMRRTVRAGTDVVSNNGEFLYALALSGNGMVNLPDFLVRDGLDRGTVDIVLPDWQIPPLNLMLYYPPYEKLPPLVETFTEFFEAYIRDLDSFDFGTGG